MSGLRLVLYPASDGYNDAVLVAQPLIDASLSALVAELGISR